ncbi:MAG TPA: DUF4112 domain-containing protein [Phenylobacterium sp.]|uniref:DUF4112 domain-containing protein n=1 Tax=Phenylobacterium sp. TaxID=1871053 RepID=UPI002BAF2C26|nr:DUF4112 domain-containing protein [Phenylobacterium sp.]HSV02866.1 DUF4112 domain-containing protein [Phenylobacterium sp.]
MIETDRETAHRAWRIAERVKRLSDDLIPMGPFGLGLDGVLAWVPGANVLYSVGAGGVLIYAAVLGRASTFTLVRMGLYLTANSAMAEVPIIGWAMDTLFRGHFMAARALQKDIERRFGPSEAPEAWRRRHERRETVRVVG